MPRAFDLRLAAIKLAQDGRVLTATAVAPPLNFVTTEFIRDLDRLTSAVDTDDTVGAVVLTGGLPGRFLIHADPSQLAGMVELPHPFVPVRAVRPFLCAAINGPAIGGGHEIALACDLRYAADAEHVRLGQIETLGCLIPGGGGTQRLTRMLGAAKALELTLEGAPVDVPEAYRLGLVHRVIPEDQLLAETQATAARLATRNPVAVAELKRAIYFGAAKPLSRGLDQEREGFLSVGTTAAATRVTRAFFEDLERLGDTPYLADLKPWLDGSRVDQTSR